MIERHQRRRPVLRAGIMPEPARPPPERAPQCSSLRSANPSRAMLSVLQFALATLRERLSNYPVR
jgi:hypothetical protein